MKVVKGYLTQTQKSSIEELFKRNLFSGKIGRTNYFITPLQGIQYEIKIVRNDRGIGWVGSELRTSTYTYIIERAQQ